MFYLPNIQPESIFSIIPYPKIKPREVNVRHGIISGNIQLFSTIICFGFFLSLRTKVLTYMHSSIYFQMILIKQNVKVTLFNGLGKWGKELAQILSISLYITATKSLGATC